MEVLALKTLTVIGQYFNYFKVQGINRTSRVYWWQDMEFLMSPSLPINNYFFLLLLIKNNSSVEFNR